MNDGLAYLSLLCARMTALFSFSNPMITRKGPPDFGGSNFTLLPGSRAVEPTRWARTLCRLAILRKILLLARQIDLVMDHL